MAEHWIQKTGVDQNKGGLHRALKVPAGKKIPVSKLSSALHSSNSHVAHMARFAANVKGIKPKKLFSTSSRKSNPQDDHDEDDGY